jgi:nitroreductase
MEGICENEFEENKMDTLEAIMKRRAIRSFQTTEVSQETVNVILEAGRQAPSWGNTQTWRWVIIRDQNIKMQMAEKVLRPGNRGTNAVKTAPVVIAACAELNRAGFREGQPATNKGGYWYMFDAGLALENMALAATSLGLGTLFIGGMDAQKAENLLAVPEGYACVILMVLGYPGEEPAPPARKQVTDLVSRDKFGER